MTYTWEHDSSGYWVVEHDGMLRTGPFSTQEEGVRFFDRELDRKIEEEKTA
jgi:hypothetical protein